MADSANAKLRLFFALWPEDDVRGRIASAADATLMAADGRVVPAVNFHMTLAFLGNVRASNLGELIRVIRSIRFPLFNMQLDHIGYWSGSQTIWMGPSEVPLHLPALVDDLWNKLDDLGFMREDLRPYSPHVTLSRKAGGSCIGQLDQPIDWPVTAFGLAKSEQIAGGQVYTVLEKFPAGI